MSEINLHPLRLGELLDKAIHLYRSRFFPLLGISALFGLPQIVVNIIAINAPDLRAYASFLLDPFFASAAIMVLAPLMAGLYVRQSQLRHRRMNDFTVLSSVFFVTLVMSWGHNFLYQRIYQSLIPGADIETIRLTLSYAYYLSHIFYFVLIARWRLSRPIIILEGQDLLAGMRRSWGLTKGWFWRICGIFFCLTVLLSIVSEFIVSLVLVFMPALSLGYSTQSILLVQTLIPAAIDILMLPLFTAIDLTIYYDLRVRKEGFDLLLRADTPS